MSKISDVFVNSSFYKFHLNHLLTDFAPEKSLACYLYIFSSSFKKIFIFLPIPYQNFIFPSIFLMKFAFLPSFTPLIKLAFSSNPFAKLAFCPWFKKLVFFLWSFDKIYIFKMILWQKVFFFFFNLFTKLQFLCELWQS